MRGKLLCGALDVNVPRLGSRHGLGLTAVAKVKIAVVVFIMLRRFIYGVHAELARLIGRG